ncbi:glycosyltransferase family 1 protein [Metabacillus indicus]|uniref:glycosyltransferase family 1 protein n=1 Tax=Metabacillus indicus TaxID=246786 RepID=UPI002A03E249|nr:glycosyltransferase family 1 protein [Metabacillus indicus]MDX8288571.1 glycosyltransferase family 1 protein [Metabacillus indicus]
MLDKNIKIMHAPVEIAGQVGLISSQLRKYGYQSGAYNFFISYLNYKQTFNTDAFELMEIFENSFDHYDIYHLHNGYSFMDSYKDLELLKQAGKKIIMHHRGNDVRAPKLARKGANYENPYVNTEASHDEEKIHNSLQLFAEVADAAIVQDHELYEYVKDYYHARKKKVYILPRLIETDKYVPAYPAKTKKPLIVHAPTLPKFKGTEQIEETIEKLKTKFSFDYIRVEKMSHEEAVAVYQRADIVIDQILCGAYGNLSVEAMALGKPVVCYIRPDIKANLPQSLPIVSANPDTLYQELKGLLKNTDRFKELGMAGRKYVERYHEASVVMPFLLDIYKEVSS